MFNLIISSGVIGIISIWETNARWCFHVQHVSNLGNIQLNKIETFKICAHLVPAVWVFLESYSAFKWHSAPSCIKYIDSNAGICLSWEMTVSWSTLRYLQKKKLFYVVNYGKEEFNQIFDEFWSEIKIAFLALEASNQHLIDGEIFIDSVEITANKTKQIKSKD